MGGGAVCQDTFCLTQFIAKVGNINNIHSITILSNPLSVSEVKQNPVSFYPNPVTNNLYINTKDRIVGVMVMSMTGQVMGNFNDKLVNVSDLESGMYILLVRTNSTVYQSRFIKE